LGTLDCNPPGKNWLLVIYLKNWKFLGKARAGKGIEPKGRLNRVPLKVGFYGKSWL
jgi:hypothetical protein